MIGNVCVGCLINIRPHFLSVRTCTTTVTTTLTQTSNLEVTFLDIGTLQSSSLVDMYQHISGICVIIPEDCNFNITALENLQSQEIK
jgi:hypothetical protein